MSCAPSDLADFATINLLFAQAEIAMGGEAEAIARALDHIQQAQHCLKILEAELKATEDEADAA